MRLVVISVLGVPGSPGKPGFGLLGQSCGGVTASTEVIAAKRHVGVHAPVIVCKTISANTQMAYAA